MQPVHDAHCHHHFPEVTGKSLQMARSVGLGLAVVNATGPQDWEAVSAMAVSDPQCIPSFGLHPWKLPTAADGWEAELRSVLLRHPAAGVGEAGLDRWVEGHDPVQQERAFRAQIALARELDRPLTVHCVRAYWHLMDVVRDEPLPRRGFLLHAWSGPAEQVPELVRLGAFFSFGTAHLVARKAARVREFARSVPRDRALLETDSPELCPDPEFRFAALPGRPDGTPVNHPANILSALRGLAGAWGVSPSECAACVNANFGRLFLSR